MKDFLFIAYLWFTSALWLVLIITLSMVPDIDIRGDQMLWISQAASFSILYAIFFLLVFRAILGTFRLKVSRLRVYTSRREKIEDDEFVRIVRILINTVAILLVFIVAIVDEEIQAETYGRISSYVDIAVNMLGVLFMNIILFFAPFIAEIEEIVFRNEKTNSKEA